MYWIQNSERSQKRPSHCHPYRKQEKAEKPQRSNSTPSSTIHKRATTNPTPSPAISNLKIFSWNIKAGERLTKDAKDSAQDASIGGNLQPAQGK